MPTGSAISTPTSSDNAERAAAEQELAALAAIDRATLNDTDKLAYDVFKYTRENDLRDLQPDLLALTSVRPINHFGGPPHFLSDVRLRTERGAVQHLARLRQQPEPPSPVRSGAGPRDRPLPPGSRLGRGRYQAHHPQRYRTARYAAARCARGLALLRAGADLSGRGAGSGPGAAARANIARSSPTASSRPTGACARSCRTNICPMPATASASFTCVAATGSTRG